MIDLTNPSTVQTLSGALQIALRKIDTDIAVVEYNVGRTRRTAQQAGKLALLRNERDRIAKMLLDLSK